MSQTHVATAMAQGEKDSVVKHGQCQLLTNKQTCEIVDFALNSEDVRTVYGKAGWLFKPQEVKQVRLKRSPKTPHFSPYLYCVFPSY